MQSSTGIFITLEGDDGVGKSTQANLLASAIEACGYEVLRVHEPGGTQVGEQIRDILLDTQNTSMTSLTELLLYEAARAQVVSELIKPALAAGSVVICDRFTDSTLAYQGFGRGIDTNVVHTLNNLACAGITPHRTLMLTLDSHLAANRIQKRAGASASAGKSAGDRMEQAGDAFHERLREGFSSIACAEGERVHVIDASGTIEQVHKRICDDLSDMFDKLSCLGDVS